MTLAEKDIILRSSLNETITVQKTKKCQPPDRDTQDLIQTRCVPDRGLTRPQNKNKLNIKNEKQNYTNVTLEEEDKRTRSCLKLSVNKQKTKKCQPNAWVTPDLIQTACAPDSGLARPQNENKLNIKN